MKKIKMIFIILFTNVLSNIYGYTNGTIYVRLFGKFHNESFKVYYHDSLLFEKKFNGITDYRFTIESQETLLAADPIDIVVKRKMTGGYYDMFVGVQYIPGYNKLIIYRSAKNKKKYMLNAFWGESISACIVMPKVFGIKFYRYFHPY